MWIRRRENRASAKGLHGYTRYYIHAPNSCRPIRLYHSLPSSWSYTLLTSVRRHTIHPTLNRPRRVQYAFLVLRNVRSEPISTPTNVYFICFPVIRWRARVHVMERGMIKLYIFPRRMPKRFSNDFRAVMGMGIGSDRFYAQIESGEKHGSSIENVKFGMKSIDER